MSMSEFKRVKKKTFTLQAMVCTVQNMKPGALFVAKNRVRFSQNTCEGCQSCALYRTVEAAANRWCVDPLRPLDAPNEQRLGCRIRLFPDLNSLRIQILRKY